MYAGEGLPIRPRVGDVLARLGDVLVRVGDVLRRVGDGPVVARPARRGVGRIISWDTSDWKNI
jgi:hypothetical protein